MTNQQQAVRVTIPGIVFGFIEGGSVYQGQCSDEVDQELHDALHAAPAVKRGFGYSVTVDLSVDAACSLASIVGACAAGAEDCLSEDPQARSELRGANRVLAQLAEQGIGRGIRRR